MNKIKAFWRVLMLLGILIFGLIMIWFVVKIAVGTKVANQADQSAMDEATQFENYVGILNSISDNGMVLAIVESGEMDINIEQETVWQLLDPASGEVVDIKKDEVVVGVPATVTVVNMGGVYTAYSVLVEPLTTLVGSVDRIEDNVLYLLDYAGVEYVVNKGENVRVFEYGKEYDLTNPIELVVGDSVVVYSNESLGDNFDINADSIGVIEVVE